jgi:hypothetical protein
MHNLLKGQTLVCIFIIPFFLSTFGQIINESAKTVSANTQTAQTYEECFLQSISLPVVCDLYKTKRSQIDRGMVKYSNIVWGRMSIVDTKAFMQLVIPCSASE